MVLAPSKSYLTSKAGPLPIWGWMGIGLGGALAYALYKQHKTAAAANAAGNQAGTPGYTLPSNIQPQNTTISEVDYSQVVQGSRRQHPPMAGRPGGRGSDSPVSHDHDGPDAPQGTWVTTTPQGPRSSLTGMIGELYANANVNQAAIYDLLVADPRNAEALRTGIDRNGNLASGMSIWIPAATGSNNGDSGHSTPAQRPGDNGRGDARRGGPPMPSPMPVQNQGRDRGGQSNGGAGYRPGGQRSNTYGGR